MKPKHSAVRNRPFAQEAVTDAFAGGKSRRKQVSRSNLARWDPKLRKEGALDILARAIEGRLPELLPIRRKRMLPGAFAFFRGAAALMAYDLSLVPHTGIINQICGDAHVQNLGAYAGEDGRLVFDINDFDETTAGPFEWDLKRMATSLLLAAHDGGLKRSAGEAAAAMLLEAYSSLVHRLAAMPILEVARFRVHPPSTGPVSEVLHKAERSSPLNSREELMEELPSKRSKGKGSADPQFRFREIPEKLQPLDRKLEDAVISSIEPYIATLAPERQHLLRHFKAKTATFKVVGVGSVGTRDYCVYLEGNGADDPLFLQIKEEAASCFAPFLDTPVTGNMGQRVVHGQRSMQFQSDPLLGWTTIDGRDFLVRQLSDHKATCDATKLDPDGFCAYAHVCGEMLAHGHARSGDARLIAGYIGGSDRFHEAIVAFAHSYASQTMADWELFKDSRDGV